MARNHNKFSFVDRYMKEFARILISENKTSRLAARLETLLHSEIAVKK